LKKEKKGARKGAKKGGQRRIKKGQKKRARRKGKRGVPRAGVHRLEASLASLRQPGTTERINPISPSRPAVQKKESTLKPLTWPLNIEVALRASRAKSFGFALSMREGGSRASDKQDDGEGDDYVYFIFCHKSTA